MRYLFTTLAFVWAVLTATVILALADVITFVGLWAHMLAAVALHRAGAAIDFESLWVRGGHGPPYLGPMGIVVCYVVPTLVFTALAVRSWRSAR